jgi:hypothetical protein
MESELTANVSQRQHQGQRQQNNAQRASTEQQRQQGQRQQNKEQRTLTLSADFDTEQSMEWIQSVPHD